MELSQQSQLLTKSPADLCWGLTTSRSALHTCAEVSVALIFDYSNSQSSSILNIPPSLQVLSEAPENDLEESEITLQSSSGAWEHLEELRRTGEGHWSVREVDMWHLDWFTFCRYHLSGRDQDNMIWSKGSSRPLRYGDQSEDASARMLLGRHYSFCRGEITLQYSVDKSIIRVVALGDSPSWGTCTSCCDHTLVWGGGQYSWVVFLSILITSDDTLKWILSARRREWNSYHMFFWGW